jgi:hypothetical protein
MVLPNTGLGLSSARKFVQASDESWPQYFEQLRRDKQLSTVIHEINELLEQPEYRQLAIAALTRIGFWDEQLKNK